MESTTHPKDIKLGDILTVINNGHEMEVVVVNEPFEDEYGWVCKVGREYSPEPWFLGWYDNRPIWKIIKQEL